MGDESLTHRDCIMRKVKQIVRFFGASLLHLSLEANMHAKDVFRLLLYTPVLQSLTLKNISGDKPLPLNRFHGLNHLTSLKELKIVDCENEVIALLSHLPSGLLKLKIISVNLEDYQDFILSQPNIEVLKIFIASTEFVLSSSIFSSLHLTQLKLNIWRYDNQGSYPELINMLKVQQPTLRVLNLGMTNINSEVFDEITKMNLETLEVNVSYVELNEFIRIKSLANIKEITLHGEIGVFAEGRLFVEAFSNCFFPNLCTLEICLPPLHYLPDIVSRIGLHCPRLKYFALQATWSYEMLHAVFRNFKQLEKLSAPLFMNQTDMGEEIGANIKISGDVNLMFEPRLENFNLREIDIAYYLESSSKMLKAFAKNFPNVENFKVTLKNERKR